MRAGIVAACIVALCLTVSAPVAAHEEYALHALTVLDRVEPAIEGLEIRVVHLGAPALSVINHSSQVVEVAGLNGEPFLRIGPDGVEANSESPTTYMSIDPNRDVVPPDADPADTPRWARLSLDPSWSWFDPRLVYRTGESEWSIPLTVDGLPLRVEGGFEPLSGHGHFITELDVEDMPGLDVRVAQGPVPALYVRNDSNEMLRVTGTENEPFLKIGPGGVWANLRSPSYYNGGSLTIRKTPAYADAEARPRWRKISDNPVWGWLEYRAVIPPEQQERDALGDQRHAIHTWTTGMRLGDRPLAAVGRVMWVPPVALSTTHRSLLQTVWQLGAVAAAVYLAVEGAAMFRRRRRLKAA